MAASVDLSRALSLLSDYLATSLRVAADPDQAGQDPVFVHVAFEVCFDIVVFVAGGVVNDVELPDSHNNCGAPANYSGTKTINLMVACGLAFGGAHGTFAYNDTHSLCRRGFESFIRSIAPASGQML